MNPETLINAVENRLLLHPPPGIQDADIRSFFGRHRAALVEQVRGLVAGREAEKEAAKALSEWKEDHRLIRLALDSDIDHTSPEWIAALGAAILAHAEAEEVALRGLGTTRPDMQPWIDHFREEHQKMEQRLRAVVHGRRPFGSLLEDLAHHLGEEEEQLGNLKVEHFPYHPVTWLRAVRADIEGRAEARARKAAEAAAHRALPMARRPAPLPFSYEKGKNGKKNLTLYLSGQMSMKRVVVAELTIRAVGRTLDVRWREPRKRTGFGATVQADRVGYLLEMEGDDVHINMEPAADADGFVVRSWSGKESHKAFRADLEAQVAAGKPMKILADYGALTWT